MSIFEMVIISVGVAMDAFAVSITQGLRIGKKDLKKPLIIALYFGIFQAVMPLIGFFLGQEFRTLVDSFAHWIAFGILIFIGTNMIVDCFSKEDLVEENQCSVAFKVMFPLAIATSIDALAVGISFAMVNTSIYLAIVFIGVITFSFSFVGAKLGSVFGSKYKKIAGFLGGIILILIGLKILLSHWGVINF